MGITSISPPIRTFSLFLISIILVIKIIETKSINLDLIGILLLAYLFLGSLVGSLNNGINYEFIRHLFAAATMLISYWAGRFLSFEGPWVTAALRWWAWISVVAGVIAWVIAYRMINSAAFSMSPVSQILSLSVGLNTGSLFMFASALFLIAFGNKRDVILGAAAILAVTVVRRYLAEMNASLRLAAGTILTIIFSLAIFLAVSHGTQLIAKISVPLPVNLAERSNRVIDFVDKSLQTEEQKPNSQNNTQEDKIDSGIKQHSDQGAEQFIRPSSFYWTLEKLSSSRASLAISVYRAVNDSNIGLFFGKGFGASYEWTYWSDNLNAWQTIVHYQSDLMPFWFLLTSGIIMSTLIIGGIAWKIIQIFVYSTRNKVEIGALLVIGSSFGMLLSFQPNVPLFWLFLGSMAVRIQNSQSS